MASKDNRPSQSLINAAVASLSGSSVVGRIEPRALTGGEEASFMGRAIGASVIGMPTTAGFFGSALGSTIAGWLPVTSLSGDLFGLYFSSMIPAISATGVIVPKQTPRGPVQIDTRYLAPEFDRDFTKKHDGNKQFVRGNQPYLRPCGSYRVALNVKDKFGNDNTWLGMTGTTSGEWPVSYHGTAKYNAQTIAEEGFKLTKGTRFRFGKGIYSTPDLDVAKRYATEFDHKGTSYKCILQNRVNPDYLKVIPASETRRGIYWLSAGDRDEINESELIRPYGICLFEQD